MVADFPVNERNRRRRRFLHVSLPEDARIFSRTRHWSVPPTIPAPTSLLVPLLEASLRWYRRSHTARDAVESPILILASLLQQRRHIGIRGVDLVHHQQASRKQGVAQVGMAYLEGAE